MLLHEPFVIGVPAFAVAAPSDAGECADTRETHVVEVVGLLGLVRDVGFAEERRLQPDDVAHLLRAEPLVREVEPEDLFRVEDRRPVVPVLVRGLAHVEIEIFARHHYGLVSLGRGVEACLDALPAVDAAVVRQVARRHRLVPHGGAFAVGAEDRRHALHEEVFQLVRVCHAPLPHQRPAVGAALPLGHVDLVAAHVDVFRGEQRAEFAQDVREQRVVLLACHAPCRTVVVAVGRQRVGRVIAADFGVYRGDVAAVPGQVDLGDNLDVAHGGIADQPAHFVLCVEAAVFLVPFPVDGAYGRVAAAEAADFGQLGVRPDLDPPPFVVRQVEV